MRVTRSISPHVVTTSDSFYAVYRRVYKAAMAEGAVPGSESWSRACEQAFAETEHTPFRQECVSRYKFGTYGIDKAISMMQSERELVHGIRNRPSISHLLPPSVR